MRNCFVHGGICERKVSVVFQPHECMLKEEYEEWMTIDGNIPVPAELPNLKFRQAVCEQDPAINIADSDGDNVLTKILLRTPRQAIDILKNDVQYLSTNVKKQCEYEQNISELLRFNC
ncbi:hypothetical protein AVEN_139265-1 [Araneus ventricosus]|uniref:Uncharacterized protein n=1 Tax=Araneus ventricosus TaxID=182803 RepID=A0A4Y2SHB6_ARAVE|nr:hypothetical protein AVEN_139265-1 [Araneus ventricosus]